MHVCPPPGLSAFPRPLPLRAVTRIPHHCVWEITNACNLCCAHCESRSGRRRPAELTTEEALNLCLELQAIGCHQVNLSGGEPLLRPDWPLIAEKLLSLGLEPILVSSLTSATPAQLRQLQTLGLRFVATSLDGPQPIHDTIRQHRGRYSPFERTVQALKTLQARGFRLAVITHINRLNLSHLEALAAFLETLRIEQWQVQLGSPAGRLQDVANAYLLSPGELETLWASLARIRKTRAFQLEVADNIGYFAPDEPTVRSCSSRAPFFSGCQAGFTVLAIEADGTVKGCPSLDIPVGNLRETPLRDLWQDEKRFWFNAHFDESLLEGRCRACPFRRICRAGCKSLALETTGSLYRNIYCLNQLRHLNGDPHRREVHGHILPDDTSEEGRTGLKPLEPT